jgi:hypothetical protein
LQCLELNIAAVSIRVSPCSIRGNAAAVAITAVPKRVPAR